MPREPSNANPEVDRFEKLTDRHRELLRLVFEHRKSAEIAHLLGLSPGYVDNQIAEAKNLLGASSRSVAAKWLDAHEKGMAFSHPEISAPSPTPLWPLPLPVPTSRVPANEMTWRQVAVWGAIIAVATPVAVTAAAMAIVALTLLFGLRPS